MIIIQVFSNTKKGLVKNTLKFKKQPYLSKLVKYYSKVLRRRLIQATKAHINQLPIICLNIIAIESNYITLPKESAKFKEKISLERKLHIT